MTLVRRIFPTNVSCPACGAEVKKTGSARDNSFRYGECTNEECGKSVRILPIGEEHTDGKENWIESIRGRESP